MSNSGITIVIPAYREEANIGAAIDSVLEAVNAVTTDYEIIVIDDGSPDRTGESARLKAQADPRVRVAVNAANQGFGYSLARGVKMAAKPYITFFPGDNDMSGRSLKELMEARTGADLIITYMSNNGRRPLARRICSGSFVVLMNALFGLSLKYYNGPLICRREVIQSISIKSTGLAAVAECVVRLVKSGRRYKVMCFEHTGRKHDKSKAFNFKSIKAVGKTIVILCKDIYWPSAGVKRT